VRIIVDDDGPGLSPAEREQVALRGQRLDETKPGSGLACLGLSIVVELRTGSSGGVLTLGTSRAPIGTRRRVVKLARIGVHIGDDVVEGLPRRVGADREDADIGGVIPELAEVIERERHAGS
jgi:signal transduction histidine kinase